LGGGHRPLVVPAAMTQAVSAVLTPIPRGPLPGPPLAPPIPWALRQAGMPRINLRRLAMVAVAGELVPPGVCGWPDREAWNELPGPGGIVLTQRVGDLCTGLAADRLEPGVWVQGLQRGPWGATDGPNRALVAYACMGNPALVLTGPAKGQRGVVTGKGGGCDHLCIDFPLKVLRRLRIGDRLQVYAFGLGLRLLDHPRLKLRHCSPRLLRGWGLASAPPRLLVPVTHRLPGLPMLPRSPVSPPGAYVLPAPQRTPRLDLAGLRFGDLVAIEHPGPAPQDGVTAIGVVVAGGGPGHGPEVLGLISGEGRHLGTVLDRRANLAAVLSLRPLPRHRRGRLPPPPLWRDP
jgi:hypothetical protein